MSKRLNGVKDEQKMMGKTVKANSEAIRDLQKSTGLTEDTAKSNKNETKGLQNQVSDLNSRLSKLEAKALQPESQALGQEGAFNADLLEEVQLWEEKLKAHTGSPVPAMPAGVQRGGFQDGLSRKRRKGSKWKH